MIWYWRPRSRQQTSFGCWKGKSPLTPKRVRLTRTRPTRSPENSKNYHAAAIPLTDAFRASVVNFSHPHATEIMSFWRYDLEDDLADPMWRLSEMLTPEASQRVRANAIVTFHVDQIAGAPKSSSVAPTDSMGPEMCERGRLAREVFENLVDVLGTVSAEETTPQPIPRSTTRK